jgi:hypothetical protein
MDPASIVKGEGHRNIPTSNPIDSISFSGLTDLPLLTYPLIIEELRPEDPLSGAFHFPHRGFRL